MLACMCGGVVEIAAVLAVVGGSAGITHYYNRIALALHNRNKERIEKHRQKRNNRAK